MSVREIEGFLEQWQMNAKDLRRRMMARLREGRANTARGAAHFLRETVGRVRHAGATGQLTMRADSGFYTHGVVFWLPHPGSGSGGTPSCYRLKGSRENASASSAPEQAGP